MSCASRLNTIASTIEASKFSLHSSRAQRGFATSANGRRNVVILGTGWAGFRLARDLDKSLYRVTVVSPRNHFLFTPLLPSTSVGTLEFRTIIESIRHIPHVKFYQASAKEIDWGKKEIVCQSAYDPLGSTENAAEAFRLTYEDLVIAIGAHNQTFGIPGVEKYANFMKEVEHARRVRLEILKCLERASEPFASEEDKKKLLSFVVVGGGPTGIELAGELSDFINEDIRKSFPHLYKYMNITLLEAGKTVLGSFDASLSSYAIKHLEKRNIHIRTATPVSEVRQNEIVLKDGNTMPFGVCVWSTGVAPRPLVRNTPFTKWRDGRLLVDNHLHVKGLDNRPDLPPPQDIYALGDCAVVDIAQQPTTAQAANQQAKYLARALNDKAKGNNVQAFVYHHQGMLAYLGGYRAINDLPGHKWRGIWAWFFWRSAYLTTLVSWSNKILVPMHWLKTLLFGRDVSYF